MWDIPPTTILLLANHLVNMPSLFPLKGLNCKTKFHLGFVEQIKAWKDACLQANGGVAKEAADLNKKIREAVAAGCRSPRA